MPRLAFLVPALLLAAPLSAQKYAAPAGAPYKAIEVTVPTPGGHTLAGTLTVPLSAGPNRKVGAIVTSTGSGPQDRNETIPLNATTPYELFGTLADSLARRGIAVLRMDDRGVGGSKGDFKIATTADFADDVRAGLAFLRTRPEIDAARLGVLGHSEGGFVAPMVAAREPDLAGIVILAGPGLPIRPIITYQLENWIRHDTTLKGGRLDSALATVPAQVDSLKRSDPWFGFIMDYDPIAPLKQLKMPVLILNGGTDQQAVPENAPKIATALVESGNRDVTMKVYPNLNHMFIYDPSGFPGGYQFLKPIVDPRLFNDVGDWLVARLGAKKR